MHADVLDQREALRRPLAGSIGLHAGIFVLVAISSILGGRSREAWGDPNALGGSVGINVVKQIPLPSRGGIVNQVANDTESAVPHPPEPAKVARQPVREPDADAIAIRSRNAKKRPQRELTSQLRYRAQKQESSNQLYSASGQALASPMVGMSGSGGVGVGTGSPFGNRYGYYVDLLRQRVAEKWRTSDVDARLQVAPPVIVTFTILRNGTARDVRLAQRSGNTVLDYSAQRAVLEASPFPPLPAGYERDEATIEFWFQLKR